MVRKTIKALVAVVSLAIVLSIPVAQGFLFRGVVGVFSPFYLDRPENLRVKLFPLRVEFAKARFSLKSGAASVTFEKTELRFENEKLSVNAAAAIYESGAKANLSFDPKKLTPEALAEALRLAFASTRIIEKARVEKLSIDGREFSAKIERKENRARGTLADANDSIGLSSDPSGFSLKGTWKKHPFFFKCAIARNSMNFEGDAPLPRTWPKQALNYFGEKLFMKGELTYGGEWNLTKLEIETSARHRLEGHCSLKRSRLDGLFTWHTPKFGRLPETSCQIAVKGAPSHPELSFKVVKGLEFLKTLDGEIAVIDSLNLKIRGAASRDENGARCDFKLCLEPFALSGGVDIDAPDLRKLLGDVLPSVGGNAFVSAKFENCRSLAEGIVELTALGEVLGDATRLPFQIDANLKNGKGKGEFSLAKGEWRGEPLSAGLSFASDEKTLSVAEFNLSFADAKLALAKPFAYDFATGAKNVTLNCLGGKLAIDRVFLAREFKDLVFSLKLKGANLRNLERFAGGKLSGTLGGELAKTPNGTLKGTVRLSAVDWLKAQNDRFYAVIEDLACALEVSVDRDRASWKLNAKDQAKLDFTSAGKIRFPDDTIDGNLKGSIKLKLLADWLATGDRIHGDVTFNARLKGKASSPTYEGYVNVDNGLYEHNEVGTFYRDITIRTKAKGKRFIVERFTGRDAKNAANEPGLTGDGWVDLSDLGAPSVNLSLRLSSLRIAQNDVFASAATGTLKISGKGRAIGCGGEATLENATYFLDQGVDSKVPVIEERNRKRSRVKKAKEYSDVFPLNIEVRVPEGALRITGMGANTRWTGDLLVKRSILNPFLVGEIRLSEGSIDALGRQLKLKEGTITFIERDRNDPKLDIVASENMGEGLVISVEIKGSGENPKIDFTSSPRLRKEEILSLLIFGKRLGEVSVLQSMRLAALAGEESTRGGGFFSKLRRNFGFDELDFKTVTRGDSLENDADATPQERAEIKTAQALRVGKTFGKIRVAVEQGTGTQSSKVTVSAPLGNNLDLRGDVGGSQNSGVGIDWVKRY